ncbi:hypothetical protein WJX82_006772 [Trebouxia sp. C0006]
MATFAKSRVPAEDLWYGTHRPSMKTNVLLQHVNPGQVKCTTFQHPPEDKVFGAPRPLDPEGAREVTGIWKQHHPNPFSQPGPDFRAMNKQATIHGLTSPQQQHSFRAEHPMHLKVGYAVKQAPAQLPSDKKPEFTYGKPSTHKTMEEIRVAGRDNPNMKHLMQGAYTWEWMQTNDARAQEFSQHAHYIQPTPTKAALGHSRHAGSQDNTGNTH